MRHAAPLVNAKADQTLQRMVSAAQYKVVLMVDTEKKLTVSFGSFSCTLSGFDDPFPVMRTVVDYFQELSQRDPSFGSKPEYVDTEMLRVIADRSGGPTLQAHVDGAEIALDTSHKNEPDGGMAALLAETTSPTPLFDEDDTFVDIAAEDIDFAVGARPTAVAEPEVPDVVEPVESTANAATEIQTTPDQKIPGEIENSFAELDENETIEDASTSEKLPTWASELISEELVEPSKAPVLFDGQKTDQTDQAESIEVNAVAQAEVVLNVDSEDGELDPENPINDLRDDFLSVQDEVSNEKIDSNGDVSQMLHDATQRFDEDGLNRQSEPLRLGFGNVASFDATKDVESTTLDMRSKPDAAKVLEKIGLYSGDGENEDFDWDDIREAVPSAFEPKEHKAEQRANKDEGKPEDQQAQLEAETLDIQDQSAEANSVNGLNEVEARKDIRQFAKATGAASLPELVEATAAFVTLVNGQPSFSRGEILGLVDELDEEEFSQKARIKSFGKLLRSGRIKRTENGDYTVAGAALSQYEDRVAI